MRTIKRDAMQLGLEGNFKKVRINYYDENYTQQRSKIQRALKESNIEYKYVTKPSYLKDVWLIQIDGYLGVMVDSLSMLQDKIQDSQLKIWKIFIREVGSTSTRLCIALREV
jgi:hypothetical protein